MEGGRMLQNPLDPKLERRTSTPASERDRGIVSDMEEEKGRSAEAMEVEDAGGGPVGCGGVWGLLSLARRLASEGKPSLALKAVVMAVKSEGGEQAVFETLHRARELYRNRLQANAAADELASLFAECAIAEAKPVTSDPPSSTEIDPSVLLPDSAENSILAISGRKQIMLDAFSDGSSFICLQCGGLVSNLRREEHVAYWCG